MADTTNNYSRALMRILGCLSCVSTSGKNIKSSESLWHRWYIKVYVILICMALKDVPFMIFSGSSLDWLSCSHGWSYCCCQVPFKKGRLSLPCHPAEYWFLIGVSMSVLHDWEINVVCLSAYLQDNLLNKVIPYLLDYTPPLFAS